MTAEFPEAWQVRLLGDVVIRQTNGKPLQQGWSPQCLPRPSSGDETWGVLKTTAIQAGQFDSSHNKELPSHLSPRPELEVAAGDILITCAGPRARCGVPALVRTTQPRTMISGKMYRFRPIPEVDPAFLQYWLMSPGAQAQIESMKTGISDSGLNLTHARFVRLTVPVPPIEEQQRIVTILDDHLSRLDAATDLLVVSERRLEGLVEASLRRELERDPCPLVSLSALLSEPLGNGRSVATMDGGFPVLRLTALRAEGVDLSERKGGAWTRDVAAPFLVRKGDYLVSRGNGSLSKVGRGSLLRDEPDEVAFPDTVIRIRTAPRLVDPEFLDLVWNAGSTRKQIESVARTTAGIYKVNQSHLHEIRLPLPALDTQKQIAARVAETRDRRSRLEREVAKARARSGVLRRSILRAAFSGELTSQQVFTEEGVA